MHAMDCFQSTERHTVFACVYIFLRFNSPISPVDTENSDDPYIKDKT